MKVLLVYPPTQTIYPASFPIGLGHIAGALLRSGHDITVWDINAERWSKGEVREKIERAGDSYQLVGMTALAGDYPYIKWFSGFFRDVHPNTKLI